MLAQYRQLLLQHLDNRFFYSEKTNTIHDRLCEHAKSIDERDLVVLPQISAQFAQGKRFCRRCLRRLAVRNGICAERKDTISFLRFFLEFFDDAEATDSDLLRLFVLEGGTLDYVHDDCVQIHLREDSWQIRFQYGKLALYHNNYEINFDCSRNFDGGFHRQNDHGKRNFRHFTRLICGYSFAFHKRQAELYAQKVMLERFRAELAIADNYACVERSSVLFDYFSFVDLPCRCTEKGRAKRRPAFRVLGVKCHYPYSLVSCRVAKWRKDAFLLQMEQIKKTALRERCFDYPGTCEALIPQLM